MDDDTSGEEREEAPEFDIDLSNEEDRERREERKEKIEKEEYTADDIQDPQIRKAVKEAQEGNIDEDAKEKIDEWREQAEEGAQRVKLSEEEEEATETSDSGPDADSSGVLADVDDADAEAAMGDVELNIRDDIDPEHFDYEDQDFSHFGSYGKRVNIEYNNVVFLLEEPGERAQQRMMNQMQMMWAGVDRSQLEAGEMPEVSLSDMMEIMIEAAVSRPEDIESIVCDWSPFERLGLGLQCMEFLGIEAMGNL